MESSHAHNNTQSPWQQGNGDRLPVYDRARDLWSAGLLGSTIVSAGMAILGTGSGLIGIAGVAGCYWGLTNHLKWRKTCLIEYQIALDDEMSNHPADLMYRHLVSLLLIDRQETVRFGIYYNLPEWMRKLQHKHEPELPVATGYLKCLDLAGKERLFRFEMNGNWQIIRFSMPPESH